MPSNYEIQRLEKVYSSYRKSKIIQAQRNECNPGNQVIFKERQKVIKNFLKTYNLWPLNKMRILEIGCGYGNVLTSLLGLGAYPNNLYGIDLLPERIEGAKKANPNFNLQCGNAEHLDFPDKYFDLVLSFTVFSSILDEAMAYNVAREVTRVLKPSGAVLWYDFRYNNPYNPNVRGITLSIIRKFFPEVKIHLRTITLLPPLARRLGILTSLLYPILSAIGPLKSHYLGILVKRKEECINNEWST